MLQTLAAQLRTTLSWQAHGICTGCRRLLLEDLLQQAHRRGIRRQRTVGIDLERDEQRVLAQMVITLRIKVLTEDVVIQQDTGQQFHHQRQASPLGATNRQRHLRLLRVGGHHALRIQGCALGQRLTQQPRLSQPAIGNHRGRHVQQQRTIRPGYRNGDRRGRRRQGARAVIGHQRWSGQQNDGGTATFGGPFGITAYRAGVGSIAHRANTYTVLIRRLHRQLRRLHHGHRAGRLSGIEHKAQLALRVALRTQLRPCLQRDRPLLDQFKKPRQPAHTMRTDTAQIGPHQGVGHHRRIVLQHAARHQQGGDKSAKRIR